MSAQNYDLYYVLPGAAGSKGVDVGLVSGDISSIGDVSFIPLMGKYSINDKLEVGAVANFGFLNDGADDLSTVLVGAKYAMGDSRAVTLGFLVPTGDADDPGLSIGLMHTKALGGMDVNHRLEVGLLDGFAAAGVNLTALIEPTKTINDKIVGYLDIMIATNTDEIGDNLGIDLGPNADIKINDTAVVNVGVVVGIAGDNKADDLDFVPKIKVEVVVSAEHRDAAIDAIVNAAKTGNVGDGKVFSYALDQAVRVRTGETGEAAL